jgi:hypothetical protein
MKNCRKSAERNSMATTPTEPNSGGDDGHRMPRWVKGFIVAAVAAVLLVVVVLLVSGSGHGPSRHLPGGEPTSQLRAGHTPPVDRG